MTAALRIAAIFAPCIAASAAQAHGFGQRYDLPLPFSLYLLGAGAAIIVSFVIVGVFSRGASRSAAYVHMRLPMGTLALFGAAIGLLIRLAALALFMVAILAGLFGDQNPYRNIVPTLVWIVFWVGLTFVSAFVGNVWPLINPWRTFFDGAAWLYRCLGFAREPSLHLPYPPLLGVWPAFIFLLAFAWVELVDPQAAAPRHLACLALGYSILTLLGMFVFGRDIWLRRGEVFTVVFDVFARFAPLRIADGELVLRPFGAELQDSPRASASATALVLLILSTVLYDGLLATPEWASFEASLRPWFANSALQSPMAIKTTGLIAFWLLFLGAYLFVSAIMQAIAHRSATKLAQSFVFTLIPIAIGYHVAHYLAFLLVQGQYFIPLLSDPLGYGWDIFGTAAYRVDIGLVGARLAWYAAVTAIVLGHIAAVYFAHAKAMRVFDSRAMALRSQVPLTALMVFYTIVSLTILAEPIVQQGAPAQPSANASTGIVVPETAVLPAGDGTQLTQVGAGKIAQAKLTYRVLGSAFHDGTKTGMADLLYAYVFAYRWGTSRQGDEIHYDPFIDAATASLRERLVALKAGTTDAISRTMRVGDVSFVRELLEVEVYTNIAPEDAERDGLIAPPWTTLPWHLMVLMEEAVARGWAAFSQAEAARRGVEWLDLVRSENLLGKLAGIAAEYERAGYRPEALHNLISEDEARQRWAALIQFYKERRHILVTNGPYRLKAWSANGATLEAFRDLTYPLGVGSYDNYAIPRKGFVTKVEWSENRLTLSADIEVIEKFQRSYRLVRTPLSSLSPALVRRQAPECRYLVADETNRIVLAGVMPLQENATFQLDLNEKISAGRYTVSALIAPNGNAMNADIKRIPIVVERP
jgi:hypothetical protein